ncbi:hypothetical protein M569_05315, partial [Genlisea aurea]
MLEAESCPASSRVREESGDEELSVLPRHTKVIVKGNNRTKSVLVGLQGVVKKAVGLGGWHWLVLKNGVEVKLQRNALSVLEPPTGNEEDDHYDFDDSTSGSENAAKEDHHHHHHHHNPTSSLQFRKVSKQRARYSKPWFSNNRSRHPPRVHLGRLGYGSLLRYWRAFHLEKKICPRPSKEQLISGVQNHFSSQKVDEVHVILGFIRAAKK